MVSANYWSIQVLEWFRNHSLLLDTTARMRSFHITPCQWPQVLCLLTGNMGRFVNHSCDGNIVVQPVFTQGCSALFYRVALFALKDIPAYEELTYSYGWKPQENAGKEVWCTCGSANCQGRLLWESLRNANGSITNVQSGAVWILTSESKNCHHFLRKRLCWSLLKITSKLMRQSCPSCIIYESRGCNPPKTRLGW